MWRNPPVFIQARRGGVPEFSASWRRLDYRFVAFGKMDGELTYRLEPVGEGVEVFQRQTLRPRGTLLKLLSPLISPVLTAAHDGNRELRHNVARGTGEVTLQKLDTQGTRERRT